MSKNRTSFFFSWLTVCIHVLSLEKLYHKYLLLNGNVLKRPGRLHFHRDSEQPNFLIEINGKATASEDCYRVTYKNLNVMFRYSGILYSAFHFNSLNFGYSCFLVIWIWVWERRYLL